MGQSKAKKDNSKSKYTKLLTGKLKEFKTWAQVKGPKTLQPALSYALDWLAPELLGTGFRMFEVSDLEMKAFIPALKTNLDSQFEIHQGLVTNAALEMSKTFIQRQMPDHFFQITGSDLSLAKKLKWAADLNLTLKITQSHLDDFFISLQKNRKAVVEFEIKITPLEKKAKPQNDLMALKLHLETTGLLA